MRLNREWLYKSNSSPELRLPRYNRSQKIGVVHLGIGAFHRAHQAVYFDQLMNRGHKDWMIIGASLRSPRVSQQLNPQNALYTVVEQNGEQTIHQIVGSIARVLIGPDDPAKLVMAMSDPNVSLVTLTVTEKGYRPALATGDLDMDDPDVRHDLNSPDQPRTALGFITAALANRMGTHAKPMTVLSCDNMPNNGETTCAGVLALAGKRDPKLAAWIAATCTFPSSMVDRIVPATTASDIDVLERSLGVRDEAMVKTEPFSQWVVEDRFVGRKPPLSEFGVQFTENVQAWEKAKLRLLNGAHSALAYLGGLAGHEYVHEAIRAPGFEAYVNRLWDEAEVTLDPVKGFDAKAYRTELLSRFKNCALQHRTFQIAMDGSQKLPQRLLSTIKHRMIEGLESPNLTLAVAAWMRWQFGVDEQGKAYIVQDPLAPITAEQIKLGQRQPRRIAAGLLSLQQIFDAELAHDPDFRAAIIESLIGIVEHGADRAVANTVGEGFS